MSGAHRLVVGTRGSALALWQTEKVRALLLGTGVPTEREEIRTTGDVILDTPLSKIGSRALFTKQLDDALLEGRIDLAVHSLKDLPTTLPAGIAICAVGLREDPRDALVGKEGVTFATLPEGATLATSSLRRRSQLLRRRPDLRIVDIRGNVDTRLAKLEANAAWHGIVLASAGLVRLGFAARISERLPLDWMLPAPGQGALAVTVRDGDAEVAHLVRAALHDGPTALCVAAERAFLRRLEGGCQVPVAAHADLLDGHLRLRGAVGSLDGRDMVTGTERCAVTTEHQAVDVGLRLAERLIGEGAERILLEVRTGSPAPVGEP